MSLRLILIITRQAGAKRTFVVKTEMNVNECFNLKVCKRNEKYTVRLNGNPSRLVREVLFRLMEFFVEWVIVEAWLPEIKA